MMQVYGEGLQRAPRPAAKNDRSKRRRLALGDRTNAKELGVAPPKKVAKKVLKNVKRVKKVTAKDLPDGWITDVSRTSGETYYRNTVTDEAQWEVPTKPAVRVDHSPPIKQALEHVHQTLRHLGAAGLRVIDTKDLTFGKTLGAGAFGTVRQATALLDGVTTEVAVKTLAFTEQDDFDEKLEEFRQEAAVGWTVSSRSRNGVRPVQALSCTPSSPFVVTQYSEPIARVLASQKESWLCETIGVAHDSSETRVDLHLILERVECDGDLHDTIHDSDNWECLRSGGEDTGAKLKSRFATTDEDDDAWAYIMSRSVKLAIAEDLARALHELRAADVVHCDIKPPNMLLSRTTLSTKPNSTTSSRDKKPSSKITTRLKLIDFGEANETIKADRIEVGTPGYMAPEVLTDGDCTSSSDIYSAGVTLIEVWHGGLWAGAETRSEGSEGMRGEILDALQQVECAEPDVGQLLRKMVSTQPADRPSTVQLIKSFKQIRASQIVTMPVANQYYLEYVSLRKKLL